MKTISAVKRRMVCVFYSFPTFRKTRENQRSSWHVPPCLHPLIATRLTGKTSTTTCQSGPFLHQTSRASWTTHFWTQVCFCSFILTGYTELVIDKPKGSSEAGVLWLLLFDCIVYDGKNLCERTYIKRLVSCKS